MKTIHFMVGINKTNAGQSFNIIVLRYTQGTTSDGKPGRINWQASRAIGVPESAIIKSLSNGDEWSNVELKNGKIVGSSGALSRFTDSKEKPWVIIAQIMNEGRIIGYDVARYDGSMAHLKLNEIIGHAEAVTANGGIPIQNAIFIKGTKETKAHFRPYAGREFIEENWEYSKNRNTVSIPRANAVSNDKRYEQAKKAKKLTEIFTKDQLREIKLGKDNKVDFRLYADPAFKASQMRELRKGLERGVNIKYVLRPSFTAEAMRYYITDLANKCDIRHYLNDKYTTEQISELSIAYASGLDISKMSDPSIPASEMSEIALRLEKGTWSELSVPVAKKFSKGK